MRRNPRKFAFDRTSSLAEVERVRRVLRTLVYDEDNPIRLRTEKMLSAARFENSQIPTTFRKTENCRFRIESSSIAANMVAYRYVRHYADAKIDKLTTAGLRRFLPEPEPAGCFDSASGRDMLLVYER